MNHNIVNKLIIIDEQLKDDSIITMASEHFKVGIELSDENIISNECLKDSGVLYVTKEFSGHVFESLMKAKKPIISDIILKECLNQNIPLPLPKYPLYNSFMKDFVVCFSPIKEKNQTDVVNRYLNLIRFMGGQSRKDMKSGKSFERTHLIESRTDSVNYKYAVIYGIPIVFKEWIDDLWQQRSNPDFDARDPNHILKFKIKPFYGLRLAFINFSNENPFELEERIQMEMSTIDNGGEVVNPNDCENCTHFVLNVTKEEPIDFNFDSYIKIPEYVVYKNWFSESLRIQYRDDEEPFQCFKSKSLSLTPKAYRSSITKNSTSILSPVYDSSFSLDNSGISKSQLDSEKKIDSRSHSALYHLCAEICETETNYVNILKAIIKIFRDPIKNHSLPGQFPNEIEIKTIFGCLPPIIEVHEKVLSKLEQINKNWSEDNEIGKVFVEHSQSFLTAYPQYVNYYEKTKEMIDECIEKYPKFNSFLKICQKEPECGKQTLQELLINPIQRLPRIEMYLKALIKKTDETKSDYKSLNEALNTIIEVNKQINKEKKKTEGQIEMFDFVNDIEDCPATLLSSHRHFIAKCDVKLLIQMESNDCKEINKFENYLFTLLLFSDLLVLCKKRTLKRTNSLSYQRSSSSNPNSVKKNSKKSYKHIETIELEDIKYIFNESSNSEEFQNAFAIITHPKGSDRSFPAYPFMVKDQETNKEKFLNHVIETISEQTPNAFQENLIQETSFKSLDFSYANTIARTVSKSKYAILRTKEKINRTFSVRKSLLPAVSLESLQVPQSTLPPSSPSSSRRISRALSHLLSPMGVPNRSSPRYLGSMTSLNENLDFESDDNFSLPTTPAPRKKKCPTIIEQNMQ